MSDFDSCMSVSYEEGRIVHTDRIKDGRLIYDGEPLRSPEIVYDVNVKLD